MRAVRLSVTLLAIGLAGCAPDTPTESFRASDEVAAAHAPGDELSPEVHAWIAQLRATLAPYHRFALADDAGYDQDITGCMVEPGVGGMGSHYANLGLFDAVVEELAPEALLYEPQKNGKLRLVAVEYIVPFTAWPDTDPAPVLHGQTFQANYRFNVWALHAWIWEHNPDGMFASWNPRITCDHAPATTTH